MAQTKYEIDMCSGPILPKLLRFTIPLASSAVLQLLFNAADVVVVGRFAGDNALAAVGANTSLINLLINLFIGISVGASIVAARYCGAKDRDGMQRTVHTSIALGGLCGIVMTFVGFFGASALLTAMNCPADVLDQAVLYLKIYSLGMLPNLLYNFGAALLRAVGDTQRSLYYLTAAGIINVVLNLFFVIVCHLDVAGVAIATTVSQCVSATLVIRCLLKNPGDVHLDVRSIRFHKQQLLQILRVGLPTGLQSIMFSISNVMIQTSVNSFGKIVVAGNSAAASIDLFIYAPVNAFQQAGAAFISQNVGAGNYPRVRQVFWHVQFSAFVFTLIFSLSIAAASEPLMYIYTKDPAVVAAGIERLMIMCTTYALCVPMDVSAGALRGVGYSVFPMVSSLIGVCALRILLLKTVFMIPAFHTTQTIYASYPITWFLTSLVLTIGFLVVTRKYKHMKT